MPHPCLDTRFISPALRSIFGLLSEDYTGGELGPEGCTIALEAVEAALGDEVEATLAIEFHTAVTGSSLSSITPADRLWRIKVLYLLYRSATSRRRAESAKFIARAEAMVAQRAGVKLEAGVPARGTQQSGKRRKKPRTRKAKQQEAEAVPKKRKAKTYTRPRRKPRSSRSSTGTTTATTTAASTVPQTPADSEFVPDFAVPHYDSDSPLTSPLTSEPESEPTYEQPKPRKRPRRKAPPVNVASDSDSDSGSSSELMITPSGRRNSLPLSISKKKSRTTEDKVRVWRSAPPQPTTPLYAEFIPPPPPPERTESVRGVIDSILKSRKKRPTSAAERKAKPKKSRKSNVLKAQADIKPKIEERRLEKPAGAVLSSTFAKVLRLVMGLPPPLKVGRVDKTAAPPAQPPVWAESRQELCEALHYYRAYQSGIYMYKRVAYGYLLDGFPAPRDMWAADGRVIISHGGGKAVRAVDVHGNEIISLLADHTRGDARIDTLMRACETRTPLILLAGERYALLPWTMRCQYVVLGWYWVSAAWFEVEPTAPDVTPPGGRDFFHRLKVRFDWVESQGTPWWLREGVGSWVPGSRAGDGGKSDEVKNEKGAEECARAEAVAVGEEVERDQTTVVATMAESRSATTLARTECIAPSSKPKAASCPPDRAAPTPPKGDARPLTPPPSLRARKRRRSSHPAQKALPTPPESPTKPYATVSITEEHQRGAAPPETATVVLPDGGNELQPQATESLPEQRTTPSMTKSNYMLSHRIEPESIKLENGEMPPSPFAGQACTTCHTFSPRVYTDGWICLMPSCPAFWMLSGSIPGAGTMHTACLPIPPGFKLTYSPAFLDPAPTPETLHLPYPVVPPVPAGVYAELADVNEDGPGSRRLWAGWVCTACGRANSRHRWELCECLGCGRQICVLGEEHIMPASALPRPDAASLREVARTSLRSSVKNLLSIGAVVVSYELPVGTIYHVKTTDTTQADRIWEAYQCAAIMTPRDKPLFQRRAIRTKTTTGQLLSQQFAINSGASYKYIVETLSYSFAEGPECVLQALDVIKSRVASVLGQKVEFNEILSVMYRDGQKMNWHDDGEKGLGPVVAALSLGSDATMSFRFKTPRVNKRSLIDRSERRPPAPPPVLNLTLRHGDVVIMSGRAIQFAYDHRVIPHGLRVAATARVIGGSEV